MSCNSNGFSCETPRRRGALAILAIMLIIFAALSVFSFMKSRGQVTPDTVAFGPYHAESGKRIFQAYNCMGCHTLVGNGAYLGPDLTKEYANVGPAWLAAFLPSAHNWPTAAAVKMQLQNSDQPADTKVGIEAYYEKFPGAKARVEQRGGQASFMPNLPFRKDEVGELIAYLKYTSEMNTEGWPPRVEVDPRVVQAAVHVATTTPPAAAAQLAPAEGAIDQATQGAQLVKDLGCTACHSTGHDQVVGPGWGGLYGSTVDLADGRKVKADDAYLTESIREPNAKVVANFPSDVMPAYTQLADNDVTAIVAYIHSLGTVK